jgi:5-methylcytosine-specific restriction endonuclease McrA
LPRQLLKHRKEMNRRVIPAAIRHELMSRKTCANVPGNFAPGCRNYICPMWKSNGGYFDESGFQIDHIVEVTHGGSNDITNLQVLCPSCHAVKTKRCAAQSWEFTSDEIDIGRAKMEIGLGKRRRANSQ